MVCESFVLSNNTAKVDRIWSSFDIEYNSEPPLMPYEVSNFFLLVVVKMLK